MDVEGHEHEALKGMIRSKVLPDVFCIENGNQKYLEMTKELLNMLSDKFEYKLGFKSYHNFVFEKIKRNGE